MKDKRLYLAITTAIDEFGERNGLKGREHIANSINIASGPNAHRVLSAYLNTTSYNHANPKRLTIDHLLDILYELDDVGALLILDTLAQEFGYHITKNERGSESKVDIFPLLTQFMSVTAKHGKVAEEIKNSVEDGVIDEREKNNLCKNISKYISKLQSLEETLS